VEFYMKRLLIILVTVSLVLALMLVTNCDPVVYNNLNYSTTTAIEGFGVPSKVHRIGDDLYILDKINGIYRIDLNAEKTDLFTNFPATTTFQIDEKKDAQIIGETTTHTAPVLWYDDGSNTVDNYRLYPLDFGFTPDNLYMFAIVKATIDTSYDGTGATGVTFNEEERHFLLRVELANFTSFTEATDIYPLDAPPVNSTDYTEWLNYEFNNRAYHMAVTNNAVYLSDRNKSLRVILITDDANHNFHPTMAFDASGDRTVISKRDTFNPGDIVVRGNDVFLAERQTNASGIDVYQFDASIYDGTPDAFGNKFTSSPYYPFNMDIDGNYLYCAVPSGLYIYDINVPFSIESLEPVLFNVTNLGNQFDVLNVHISGTKAYCPYGNGVIAITDPMDATSGSPAGTRFVIPGWVTDTVDYNDGVNDFIISPSQTVKTSANVTDNEYGALFIHRLN
jgi:hypothetical protein